MLTSRVVTICNSYRPATPVWLILSYLKDDVSAAVVIRLRTKWECTIKKDKEERSYSDEYGG
jgi:hypothetical protein